MVQMSVCCLFSNSVETSLLMLFTTAWLSSLHLSHQCLGRTVLAFDPSNCRRCCTQVFLTVVLNCFAKSEATYCIVLKTNVACELLHMQTCLATWILWKSRQVLGCNWRSVSRLSSCMVPRTCQLNNSTGWTSLREQLDFLQFQVLSMSSHLTWPDCCLRTWFAVWPANCAAVYCR